jgi:hypothetical protein
MTTATDRSIEQIRDALARTLAASDCTGYPYGDRVAQGRSVAREIEAMIRAILAERPA